MEFTPELWQEILFLADWLWENGQKAEGLRDIDLFQELSLNQIRILRMVQIMTIPLFDNAVRPEGVSLKELAARLNVTAAAASEWWILWSTGDFWCGNPTPMTGGRSGSIFPRPCSNAGPGFRKRWPVFPGKCVQISRKKNCTC